MRTSTLETLGPLLAPGVPRLPLGPPPMSLCTQAHEECCSPASAPPPPQPYCLSQAPHLATGQRPEGMVGLTALWLQGGPAWHVDSTGLRAGAQERVSRPMSLQPDRHLWGPYGCLPP